MRNFPTIFATSAVLSASIFAGLASADVPTRPGADPVVSVAAVATPARPAEACPADAWPYRRTACRTGSEDRAAQRRVRVIRIEDRRDAADEIREVGIADGRSARRTVAGVRAPVAPARR